MKNIARKIPSCMATQHPDHAGVPYWHNEPYIPAILETKELFNSYHDIGVDEYKWDWEGKLVDESVLERLLAEHYEYFKKNPIGKKLFLTFRLPNPKVQTEFRLARALMGIATSAGLAKQVGIHSPPLFEVILPMTESAEEIINIQEAFQEIAQLKHPLNRFEQGLLPQIEMIPLFEQVDTIINSHTILEKYLEMHKKSFHTAPEYIRPYVARSDPALNSGIVPTVIAIKIALSRYKKFENKHKVSLFPIIGCGALPFRGGLYPLRPERFMNEYSGIRTVTIQSAFRYDYPKTIVTKAIQKLKTGLPHGKITELSLNEENELEKAIRPFEKAYKQTIEKIAPLINDLARFIPKRRERVQHIGLFGYSRGAGKVSLPRAISFTAVMYSLGIPPELIGSGRGIKAAQKKGTLHLIEKNYRNLKHDLYFAGKFFYRQGLVNLAKKSSAWRNILDDVAEIEKYLGKPFAPKYLNEQEHQLLSAYLHKHLKNGKVAGKLISDSAVLRKSMG